MPTTIDIVISGLIALVPNHYTHPTLTTAYVITDQYHAHALRLYGKNINISEHSPGAPDCWIPLHLLDNRSVVECDLADTDIRIDADVSPGRPYLPPNPRKPRPENAGDLEELDWLVHISNVDSRVRGVKQLLSSLEGSIGARFNFPWNSAKVCELDGSEHGAAELIGFTPSSGSKRLTQAVAESMLFRMQVVPGRLSLVLSNRNGGARTITAECSPGPDCFAIEIDNSLRARGNCADPPSPHFMHYYDLVSHNLGNERPLPFRISGDYICVSEDRRPIDFVLLGCGLDLASPAAPNLRPKVRKLLETDKYKTIGQLRTALDDLRKGRQADSLDKLRFNKHELDLLLTLLEETDQVRDRVVCPPVVLSP